jgi:hypothetical protein
VENAKYLLKLSAHVGTWVAYRNRTKKLKREKEEVEEKK